MRALVIEDERLLADTIARGLRRHAIATDVVYNGAEATTRIGVHDYDVVVLDRNLPTVGGDEICGLIARDHPGVRILMLTAATTIRDRVEGLRLGADDYMTKPFAFAELVARVRALGRRARTAPPPVLSRAGIEVDVHRREARRDGTRLSLSNKEFAVLEELVRAQGGVVSAERLLDKAWDENIDPFTGVVRYTVMMLRRKLGEPAVVETVAGAGYRIP